MSKHPQDANKRQITFYVEEAIARRLDKYCEEKNITKTGLLVRFVAELVAEVELTDQEALEVTEAIQARIRKGYNVPRRR